MEKALPSYIYALSARTKTQKAGNGKTKDKKLKEHDFDVSALESTNCIT